jgi:hypothetical protein
MAEGNRTLASSTPPRARATRAASQQEERLLFRQLHRVAARQNPVALSQQILHDDGLAGLAFAEEGCERETRALHGPPGERDRDEHSQHGADPTDR